MRRLTAITQDKMSPEQTDLFEKITSGPRSTNRSVPDFLDGDGGLRGPFNALMFSPTIGDITQQLGEHLRFRSSLPGSVREVAILTVGQFWQADYEFWAHAKAARRENVSEAAIEAVKQGRAPTESDLAAIHAFVMELMETRKSSDETYAAAHAVLGDQGMVELVFLAGYYCMISANLNVFRAPMPEGEDAPFGTV